MGGDDNEDWSERRCEVILDRVVPPLSAGGGVTPRWPKGSLRSRVAWFEQNKRAEKNVTVNNNMPAAFSGFIEVARNNEQPTAYWSTEISESGRVT